MKRPKISEPISPLTKSRHSAKTPAVALLGHRDKHDLYIALVPRVRAALDLIAADHFSRYESGLFTPVVDALLRHGDHYRHLADLTSYGEAHQRLGESYADPEAWARQVVLNIAASGQFSSDRTIAEYAREIWQVAPVPVD